MNPKPRSAGTTDNQSATFDQLRAALESGGPQAALELLADQLRREHKYHELFDTLLMRGRLQLGLPIILSGSLDDLPEPTRTQVEQEYIGACREVGSLLMEAGQLREAWMYLRPVADNALVAAALEKIEPQEANLQDLIEIALHEGAAVPLGFRLVLEHFGTCNAITTFEGVVAGRSRPDQQAAAELLVRHVHRELLASVRSDIQKQSGLEPAEQTLAALVADRDWLFGEYSYHLDTTHLASTVRFARVLEQPEPLELAWDLTAYGRRLAAQFQFPGDEPFKDNYPSHGLFFAAMLGRQVDEALAYFRGRAETLGAEVGTLPAEVYVLLLDRSGRHDEALAAAAKWLPPGTRTTGFAPNLMELSRRAGSFDRLIDTCRERGDLVGFTAGLLESARRGA